MGQVEVSQEPEPPTASFTASALEVHRPPNPSSRPWNLRRERESAVKGVEGTNQSTTGRAAPLATAFAFFAGAAGSDSFERVST